MYQILRLAKRQDRAKSRRDVTVLRPVLLFCPVLLFRPFLALHFQSPHCIVTFCNDYFGVPVISGFTSVSHRLYDCIISEFS